jgi:hypothetical protein
MFIWGPQLIQFYNDAVAMFSQAPGFVCILSGPQHVYEFANTAYRKLVGDRSLTGKPIRVSAVPRTPRCRPGRRTASCRA